MRSSERGRIPSLKRIDHLVDTGGVNRSTGTTAQDHTARIARAAWFCAFILPLVLASLLLGVKTAQADPAPAETAPAAFEEEVEDEDEGEFAETECEIAMEEGEEGEITKDEAETLCKEARQAARSEGSGSTSAECPIHSVSAHASTHHDQLKLTIGYTTNTPVAAIIQIHGIGTFKRHLDQSGVLRFTGEEHGRPVIHIKLPASERAGCTPRRLVLFPS